jgi:hypothetical protein
MYDRISSWSKCTSSYNYFFYYSNFLSSIAISINWLFYNFSPYSFSAYYYFYAYFDA